MKANADPNRIFLVTGATGAIGQAIARRIAAVPSNSVVMICRDEAKAIKMRDEIQRSTGNRNVRYLLADLSDKDAVFTMAEGWEQPADVLVNNAATTPRRREETVEGIEKQFATNVLGYFWMIKAFTPHLKKAADSRVVNVASYWAGDMDLEDLEFRRRRYNNNIAYRQSKQGNRMLTVAFAERLGRWGISVNACHPGDVNSALSNSLGFGGHETPDQGADTPVWLATDSVGQKASGKYFENRRHVRCRFGENRRQVEELYAICDGF